MPAPARALDRVERAGGELFDAVCPGNGPRAAPPAAGDRLPRSRGAARRAGLGALRRERRAGRARGPCGWAPSRTCRRASTRASSSASSGPSRTPSRGRRWTCPGRCASGCGTTARLRSSSRRRSAPATTSPSSAIGSACEGPTELRVGSPFRFEEQALLYLPDGLPDPRSEGALELVAEEAAALCALSRGRALVLTSSYRALDVIAARLRGRLPLRGARPGRRAARAPARALRARGRLGARGDRDLLAGRRRPRRGADAARDRQAAVPGARRPARRGALRADLGRGRATGSATTRCPPPSSSCARASAG